MGIGLAIPLDKFEIQNVDVSTLSDRRKGGWPKAPRESESGVIRKVVKGVIIYQSGNPTITTSRNLILNNSEPDILDEKPGQPH
jgi:hypothetical protein